MVDIFIGVCVHSFEYQDDDGTYSCVLCGLINSDLKMVHLEYQKKEFVLQYKYIRIEYFKKKLSTWIDIPENKRISFNTMYEKLNKLPCPCTWKQIYDCFKGSKEFTKYYAYILTFLEIKIDYSTKDQALLETVDDCFDHLNEKYKWGLKKKFCIYYIIYKSVQMRGGRSETVPVKLSVSALVSYDKRWEQVCEYLKWKYIPSEICKLDWNKEKWFSDNEKNYKPIQWEEVNGNEAKKIMINVEMAKIEIGLKNPWLDHFKRRSMVENWELLNRKYWSLNF